MSYLNGSQHKGETPRKREYGLGVTSEQHVLNQYAATSTSSGTPTTPSTVHYITDDTHEEKSITERFLLDYLEMLTRSEVSSPRPGVHVQVETRLLCRDLLLTECPDNTLSVSIFTQLVGLEGVAVSR